MPGSPGGAVTRPPGRRPLRAGRPAALAALLATLLALLAATVVAVAGGSPSKHSPRAEAPRPDRVAELVFGSRTALPNHAKARHLLQTALDRDFYDGLPGRASADGAADAGDDGSAQAGLTSALDSAAYGGLLSYMDSLGLGDEMSRRDHASAIIRETLIAGSVPAFPVFDSPAPVGDRAQAEPSGDAHMLAIGAALSLANRYTRGIGVKASCSRAAEFYRRVASDAVQNYRPLTARPPPLASLLLASLATPGGLAAHGANSASGYYTTMALSPGSDLFKYYVHLADGGERSAQMIIARALRGSPAHRAAADEYLERAARRGSIQAICELGNVLLDDPPAVVDPGVADPAAIHRANLLRARDLFHKGARMAGMEATLGTPVDLSNPHAGAGPGPGEAEAEDSGDPAAAAASRHARHVESATCHTGLGRLQLDELLRTEAAHFDTDAYSQSLGTVLNHLLRGAGLGDSDGAYWAARVLSGEFGGHFDLTSTHDVRVRMLVMAVERGHLGAEFEFANFIFSESASLSDSACRLALSHYKHVAEHHPRVLALRHAVQEDAVELAAGRGVAGLGRALRTALARRQRPAAGPPAGLLPGDPAPSAEALLESFVLERLLYLGHLGLAGAQLDAGWFLEQGLAGAGARATAAPPGGMALVAGPGPAYYPPGGVGRWSAPARARLALLQYVRAAAQGSVRGLVRAGDMYASGSLAPLLLLGEPPAEGASLGAFGRAARAYLATALPEMVAAGARPDLASHRLFLFSREAVTGTHAAGLPSVLQGNRPAGSGDGPHAAGAPGSGAGPEPLSPPIEGSHASLSSAQRLALVLRALFPRLPGPGARLPRQVLPLRPEDLDTAWWLAEGAASEGWPPAPSLGLAANATALAADPWVDRVAGAAGLDDWTGGGGAAEAFGGLELHGIGPPHAPETRDDADAAVAEAYFALGWLHATGAGSCGALSRAPLWRRGLDRARLLWARRGAPAAGAGPGPAADPAAAGCVPYDFYRAKHYFDLAAARSPDARLAVGLALLGSWLSHCAETLAFFYSYYVVGSSIDLELALLGSVGALLVALAVARSSAAARQRQQLQVPPGLGQQ
ncbi:hypothetical protein H696_05729 [Fonticula alba]|uniref:Uncharacterized protein n=1 Tax=Fonticula alba TaxID=691883 RepID=A0A058Z2N1_FONAL|nr:hypothetical protein H696_05729 [Fonticula alba]KCV67787.1 hypothetical protein H696_05729 [Fonticula alba]|eukprot:XP_009497818.1 hypothetical protein H696_05729 [Fonticula alba]